MLDSIVTRRGLLGAVAVSLTGLHAAPRVSKLKFGLTSYEWGKDWDIPTFIANCTRAKAYGVELRTSAKYAHGLELDTPPEKRNEAKRRFADSPVKLISIASAERFDSPDPEKLRAAIEKAKAHVLLSRDVGSTGVRVFPNDFHKEVPQEQTVAQIAKALNEVGKFAEEHGQKIRLENHGSAGRLTDVAKILAQVDSKAIGVKLNGDVRDVIDGQFAPSFGQVKNRLGETLHFRMYGGSDFPYQQQWDLLVDAGWEGWCFVEESVQVPDRVQALIEERQQWESMIAKSLARKA